MAMFRRLFYKKPPDHLLEISERVYGNIPFLTSLPLFFSLFLSLVLLLASWMVEGIFGILVELRMLKQFVSLMFFSCSF